MAIMKKGAKGDDVKLAQKLLNKNGAKLKEDGEFGPKTDAATKAVQKKMKLKVDGQIGPITMAALKYGKALPTMTVEDYSKRMAKVKANWKDNGDVLTILKNSQKSLADASEKATQSTIDAFNHFNGNHSHFEEAIKAGDQIIEKQKQFEKLRTKDPAAAEKLAKECDALDAKINDIAKKKISPNRVKADASIQQAKKAMDQAIAAIEKCRKDIKAEKATW